VLNYDEYIKLAKHIEEEESKLEDMKEEWNLRGKEFAHFFQNLKCSVMYYENEIKNGYKIFYGSHSFFGLYMNWLQVNINYDGTIELVGTDYDNDVVGLCKIKLEDFLRDDWKEYFTKLIEEWERTKEKEKQDKKESEERELYERLAKKYGKLN